VNTLNVGGGLEMADGRTAQIYYTTIVLIKEFFIKNIDLPSLIETKETLIIP
jgi:hypothetical protein